LFEEDGEAGEGDVKEPQMRERTDKERDKGGRGMICKEIR
jgi:hypothetical protein